MQSGSDFGGPSDNELRMRAAAKVARRRGFMVSAGFLGSLIVLNLYFYSQSHSSTWLLLDAVFVGLLCFRAWLAFGSGGKDEQRIRQEIDRMRAGGQYRAAPAPAIPSPSISSADPASPIPSTSIDPSAPPPPPAPPPTGSRDRLGF